MSTKKVLKTSQFCQQLLEEMHLLLELGHGQGIKYEGRAASPSRKPSRWWTSPRKLCDIHPCLVGLREIAQCHRTAQRRPVIQLSPLGRVAEQCVYCCSLSEPSIASWAFPFCLCEQKSIDDSSCEMPGRTCCHMGALAQGILSNICV